MDDYNSNSPRLKFCLNENPKSFYRLPLIYQACASGKLDAYRVLNIPRNSSKARIRQAYLEQMKQYHPDVSMDEDANSTAVSLNAAYEELMQACCSTFKLAKRPVCAVVAMSKGGSIVEISKVDLNCTSRVTDRTISFSTSILLKSYSREHRVSLT